MIGVPALASALGEPAPVFCTACNTLRRSLLAASFLFSWAKVSGWKMPPSPSSNLKMALVVSSIK
jgi:hypothetical protein